MEDLNAAEGGIGLIEWGKEKDIRLDKIRKDLNVLMIEKSCDKEKILKKSQELDMLINHYMMRNIAR